MTPDISSQGPQYRQILARRSEDSSHSNGSSHKLRVDSSHKHVLCNSWIDGCEGEAPAEPERWFRLGRASPSRMTSLIPQLTTH